MTSHAADVRSWGQSGHCGCIQGKQLDQAVLAADRSFQDGANDDEAAAFATFAPKAWECSRSRAPSASAPASCSACSPLARSAAERSRCGTHGAPWSIGGLLAARRGRGPDWGAPPANESRTLQNLGVPLSFKRTRFSSDRSRKEDPLQFWVPSAPGASCARPKGPLCSSVTRPARSPPIPKAEAGPCLHRARPPALIRTSGQNSSCDHQPKTWQCWPKWALGCSLPPVTNNALRFISRSLFSVSEAEIHEVALLQLFATERDIAIVFCGDVNFAINPLMDPNRDLGRNEQIFGLRSHVRRG